MKKGIITLLLLLLLVGCSTPASPDEEDTRDKVLPDSIRETLEEAYEAQDSNQSFVSYWFYMISTSFDTYSEETCSDLFEENPLTVCSTDINNVFPSDMNLLSTVEVVPVTSGDDTNFEITTEYEDGTSAYTFIVELNPDTLRFSQFTYTEIE